MRSLGLCGYQNYSKSPGSVIFRPRPRRWPLWELCQSLSESVCGNFHKTVYKRTSYNCLIYSLQEVSIHLTSNYGFRPPNRLKFFFMAPCVSTLHSIFSDHMPHVHVGTCTCLFMKKCSLLKKYTFFPMQPQFHPNFI